MALLTLSNVSILLVDDVLFARKTVERLLRSMGDPTIFQADDGADALDILRSGKKIDFVISDFNMPNFNGLQLLKAVRTGAAGVDSSLPFAMLTGFSDKHLVDMALALDVSAFLLKPVSKKTLTNRLEKMLTRGEDDALKPPDDYGDIVIEEAEEEEPPLAMDTRQDRAQALKAMRRDAEADAEPAPKAKPKAEPRPKPGAPELDPRQVGARAGVMRRLSSLKGKFDDSDLAQDIGQRVETLVSGSGERAASRIVSYLDGLVKRGILDLEDLPDVLASEPLAKREVGVETADADAPALAEGAEAFFPLKKVPADTALSRNLHTTDGSLFMIRGTELTPQIVSILAHLEKRGVLALETGDGGEEGVFVTGVADKVPEAAAAADEAPSRGGSGNERRVPADKVPPGSILARDIFTADGRLYLHAGAQLSERMVSILQDLDQLGHMHSELWIDA